MLQDVLIADLQTKVDTLTTEKEVLETRIDNIKTALLSPLTENKWGFTPEQVEYIKLEIQDFIDSALQI